MMEKASEVLLKARELIERPERWCQYSLAKRSDGEPTDYTGADAASWCAVGAVYRAGRIQSANAAVEFLNAAAPDGRIVWLNNHRTHAEVLGAFNKAIGLALQQEQPTADAPPARVERPLLGCAPALAGGDPVAV